MPLLAQSTGRAVRVAASRRMALGFQRALSSRSPSSLAPRAWSLLAQASGANSQLPWNTVVKFVPQQHSWVVERFGRFSRVLEPGLAVLVPLVERIAYAHSMKEVAVDIPCQSAITADNVSLELDGVLYYKIVDAIKASYGVENPHYAVAQLAQTTMRAQIGGMTLDRTLAERTLLNARIVEAINDAARSWGIECLRYEVRDLHVPAAVLQAMHSQVAAERSKRALILESEGSRQSAINVAEGDKAARILASDAAKQEAIRRAEGDAKAVELVADASARAIETVARAVHAGSGSGAPEALALDISRRWIDAWSNVARGAGSTVVVGANMADPSSIVAQGTALFQTLSKSFSATTNSTSLQTKGLATPSSAPVGPSSSSNSNN